MLMAHAHLFMNGLDVRHLRSGVVSPALVVLLCGVLVIGGRSSLADELSAGSGLITPASQRTVRFGFVVENTTGRVIDGARVGVFIPVKQAAGQDCCEAVASNYPTETIRDAQGNQALGFVFEYLPPHGTRKIDVSATLTITADPLPAPEPDADRWLGAGPLIQADHPRIEQQARQLGGNNPLETARRIHDWISKHSEYSGYLRDARGALDALEQRRGDCTEYMYLFIALARANGIPARGMAGYLVERDAVIRADTFHNWAEFCADGAWRIADPQRGGRRTA